jgi:hypothetical protein
MTGFIAHFDTARDYTLQITITHTLVSTVISLLPLLGNSFQRRLSLSSRFPYCLRPQLSASNSNSSQQLNPSSSITNCSSSRNYVTTDVRSPSLSWCWTQVWGPRPDFCYCQTVTDLLMWGALSDGRTCVQLLLVLAREVIAGLTTIFYCIKFETPPTLKVGPPYLHPPGTGWPSYTSGTVFPFRRFLPLAGLRWRYSNLSPRGELTLTAAANWSWL